MTQAANVNEQCPDVVETKYWQRLDDGRVQCNVCPRFCKLHEGQRGLCFVRANQDNKIVLTTWGRSSGFAVDPIEKKPLNHFLPGTPVLSFGTAGCNLACKFCQNWDISKSREMDSLMVLASPEKIAQKAKSLNCRSVAYTYNDPVIFHEYAIDVAQTCNEHGIKNVAVTAGYVCPEPRQEFYQYMDAVNVDLKAFTERFYHKITGSHLDAVLDTIQYIKHETNVWMELTTLLIPDENDSEAEIDKMTQWVVDKIGPDVPIHFSVFHPDWKMRDKMPTRPETVKRAREIAIENGIHYAYVGNMHDKEGDSTWCYQCGALLIARDWYDVCYWNLTASGNCPQCGTHCEGVFEEDSGMWGAQRVNVTM